MSEDIRPLPQEYSSHGTVMKLLERGVKSAIYGGVMVEETNTMYYEVFVVRIAKASKMKFGDKITEVPAREKVPSDEEFGTYGWTANTLERARFIANEIDNNIRPRSINKETNEYI